MSQDLGFNFKPVPWYERLFCGLVCFLASPIVIFFVIKAWIVGDMWGGGPGVDAQYMMFTMGVIAWIIILLCTWIYYWC